MCWGRCERVILFVNDYDVMAWGLLEAASSNEQEGR